MKKTAALIVAMLLVSMFVGCANAAYCDHQNIVYDFSRQETQRYVDKGDYHEVITLQPMVCSDCGAALWIEADQIGVEGHNYAMTFYSSTHRFDDTHEYHFTCMDCSHLVILFGECGGPPCEIVYVPAP